jgi:hypothetical protein
MPEPPYGIIYSRLKAGRVIPFLGAGASLVGRPPGAVWNAKNPTFLPSGLDLAHFLADQAELPSTDERDRGDLAKVSSYYVDIAGRSTLRECLREVLNHNYQSGPLHQFLAEISPHLIVVTNYDTLLEQAFLAAKKPYDLLIYPADRKDIANAILWWPHGAPEPVAKKPNELDIDLEATTVIYKMHGSVVRERDQWDSFVITEEDYIEFLSRMTTNTAVPSFLYPYFRERSFLFLGYSLRDWNLRVVLRNLSKHLASRNSDDEDEIPSWAIQLRPSPLEQRLWLKKNVNIFDMPLDEFMQRMRERMGSG